MLLLNRLILSHSDWLRPSCIKDTLIKMQQISVEKILDPAHRARDAAGVDSVIDVVEAMIKPFDYERSELINIYSGSCCILSLSRRFYESL